MSRPSPAARRPAALLLMAIVLGLALVAPLATQNITRAQSTIIVTNNADSGAGSLREAIDQAQDGDTITFADSVASPIGLATPIQISKGLTIAGPGADVLTVSGNNVTGVFYISSSAPVTIDGLTIRDGSTDYGAAIYNFSPLTIINSTISGNTASSGGGGIYNGGALTIANSTISDNSAGTIGGGGIYSFSTVTITNSTISGNTASGSGGGIYNGGSLTIANSTIFGNAASSGGGGILDVGSSVNLTATIMANNAPGNNCVGFITSGGYNLSSDATCFNAGGTDMLVTDPLLDDLDDNGGPTATHALLDGSPAIDAFPVEACTAALGVDPVDQRGINRPMLGACDIGAFELTSPPTLVLPPPMTVEAISAAGALVDFSVSAVDFNGDDLAVDCDYEAGDPFELGTTPVTCSATDSLGKQTEGTFTITVSDTTPPAVSVPTADLTFEATGLNGTEVDFVVTATDTVDPNPDITCTPPSGSVFEIGTTTVSCTATDDAGNTSEPATFSVTVLGADALLPPVIQDMHDADVPAYLKPRLLVFLTTAELALERGQPAATCSTLQMFSDQVAALSPRYITPVLAEQLTSDAQSIRDVLGCEAG